MNSWKDLANSKETGEPLNKLPDGMEIVPVVGVTFVEDYPTNLHRLSIVHSHRRSDIDVELRRDPDNKYDANAVQVRYLGYMVGHLSREVAARIAPLLDSGKEIRATVFQVRISPENPNNPGLDILLDHNAY